MSDDEAPKPAAPKKRWPWLVAGVIALAGVAGAGVYYRWRTQALAPLLARFPDDSYLVATLDVDALRKGPLADLAAETEGTAKKRAEGLLGACAEGAIAAVREVGLVVPGGSADEGTFALAARLDTSGAWAAACDAELAQRSATVPRESEGAWNFVGGKEGPRLAIHRSGLAIWGREPYLHTLAGALFRDDAERRYQAFAARTLEANTVPQAFVAITLPAEQRRVFASVIEEQGRSDAHPELFAIARAGLTLTLDGAADTLRLAARLETDDPAATAKLRGTIEELLVKVGDSLEARALGAGDALENAQVTTANDAVVVKVAAPIGRLRMMAKRLRLLGELRKLTTDLPARAPADAPPSPPSGAPQTPKP